MSTHSHLTLAPAPRRSTRRSMPTTFLGRPVEVYRARYRTPRHAGLPLAA